MYKDKVFKLLKYMICLLNSANPWKRFHFSRTTI